MPMGINWFNRNEGTIDSTEIQFMPSFQNEGINWISVLSIVPSFWKEGIKWISVLSFMPSFWKEGIKWQYWNPIYALLLFFKITTANLKIWLFSWHNIYNILSRFAQEYKNVIVKPHPSVTGHILCPSGTFRLPSGRKMAQLPRAEV